MFTYNHDAPELRSLTPRQAAQAPPERGWMPVLRGIYIHGSPYSKRTKKATKRTKERSYRVLLRDACLPPPKVVHAWPQRTAHTIPFQMLSPSMMLWRGSSGPQQQPAQSSDRPPPSTQPNLKHKQACGHPAPLRHSSTAVKHRSRSPTLYTIHVRMQTDQHRQPCRVPCGARQHAAHPLAGKAAMLTAESMHGLPTPLAPESWPWQLLIEKTPDPQPARRGRSGTMLPCGQRAWRASAPRCSRAVAPAPTPQHALNCKQGPERCLVLSKAATRARAPNNQPHAESTVQGCHATGWMAWGSAAHQNVYTR